MNLSMNLNMNLNMKINMILNMNRIINYRNMEFKTKIQKRGLTPWA